MSSAAGRNGEANYTGTGFPRVFYLAYHLYRDYFPLLALTTYKRDDGTGSGSSVSRSAVSESCGVSAEQDLRRRSRWQYQYRRPGPLQLTC